MDDWEKDDFEPTVPSGGATDKWEGEDEDDNVKNNWEDEDEEKKANDEDKPVTTAYQKPKKKPLAARIAEKSKQKQLEEEEREKEAKPLSPEEQLAEKIRLQKVQEDSDLKLAKGLFGIGDGQSKPIESMLPETPEEFEEFGQALKNKIVFFEGSKLYPEFVEKLFADIALTMPTDSIKKIGLSLNTLYHEKERLRKEEAKTKKKKQKATIKVSKKDDLGLGDETSGGVYYDDDDDFI